MDGRRGDVRGHLLNHDVLKEGVLSVANISFRLKQSIIVNCPSRITIRYQGQTPLSYMQMMTTITSLSVLFTEKLVWTTPSLQHHR